MVQQSAIFEPVNPFERSEFDGVEGAPWLTPANDLGLVEAVNGSPRAVS